MTIKVCRKKAMDNLSKCGKAFSKALQLFFLSWIFIGIYWLITGYYNQTEIVLALMFGSVISFFFVPVLRTCKNNEYETILHDINKTLKLFKWNEDC